MAETSEIVDRGWFIKDENGEAVELIGPIRVVQEVPDDDPRAGTHQLVE